MAEKKIMCKKKDTEGFTCPTIVPQSAYTISKEVETDKN